MSGEDGFVPISRWLHRQPEADARSAPAPLCEEADETATFEERDELDDALAAVRRFRAALDDALDTALDELLERIAREVVARELRLAPADLAAVVADAKARYALHEALVVRVHPDDAQHARDLGTVVADARMQRGDVVLEVRGGAIDATLAARLERLLAVRNAP